MSVSCSYFGTMPDSKEVKLYTITNQHNIRLQVITLGATLQALYTPDNKGRLNDITIGFDSLYGHLNFSDYQGKTVGRYANRIANGRFTVSDKEYQLTQNEKNKTCLHSAGEFSSAVWDSWALEDNSVMMKYTSPDGSNGFAGKLSATIKYSLSSDDKVVIEYSAVCDKDTVMNFTNHTYFNLTGSAMSNVLDHIVQINSSHFTPTDADSIPTGEIRPVSGTPFDFREPTAIGQHIADEYDQLIMCKGYDHNFCLDHKTGRKADVTVIEPVSGRTLKVYTNLPGVQFYTGNFLDGKVLGKGAIPLVKNSGFCLETQYYPDTPNHPQFPQCTFKAGKEFKSKTVFAIGCIL